MFLMYRVELKDRTGEGAALQQLLHVPNVPCGVERFVYLTRFYSHTPLRFLMYRVELKVPLSLWHTITLPCTRS